MPRRATIPPLLKTHGLTVALLLLALAYTLTLRLYDGSDKASGRILDDAGRQLYQAVRVLDGQWFYRDFSTGMYQPGALLWHALLFKLFGIKMSVVRTSLAVVGAGIAVLAYLLARRLMAAGWAILVYLLCLSWNVFNVNVGYPSWYCTLLGLAAALLTLRYVERGGAWQLALAGALVGVSLAFKVSQGAYQAIGLALGLAWRSAASQEPRSWRRRLVSLESACAGALALSGLVVLWSAPTWLNVLYFGAPLLLVAGAIVLGRPRLEAADAGTRPFLRELLWLGLGWVVATIAWAAPSIAGVGWKLFLDGTLLTPLLGAQAMHNTVSVPTLNGWLVLIAILAGASALRQAERIRPLWVAGCALAVALIAVLPLRGAAGLPATIKNALATRQAILPLAFFLAGIAAWLTLWRGEIEQQVRARLGITLAFAAWNMLVYYPLADTHHLSWAAPPLFVVLAYLFYELSRRAQRKVVESRRRWIVPVAIGALLAGVCILQFYVVMRHFVYLGRPVQPVAFEMLDTKRADVYMPAAVAQAFRQVAQAVVERTDEGDAVFDTCGSFINFMTGRRNPTGIDFTWPGLHSPEEQWHALQQLREDPPALILRRSVDESARPLGNPSVRQSYAILFEFIEQHYELTATAGEYSIWSPK